MRVLDKGSIRGGVALGCRSARTPVASGPLWQLHCRRSSLLPLLVFVVLPLLPLPLLGLPLLGLPLLGGVPSGPAAWLSAAFSPRTCMAVEDAKPTPKPAAGASGKPAAGEKRRANRLGRETSPYLLLHAHNPVDWYPWGEEALAKAKRENKLIFLSIGYSSCHWCHVMERESFLDDEIAAVLNKNFVCIKVDREERPDVDTVYMTSLQVFHRLSRSGRGGGWPLSMFLTPDAEPFFGGTYFPARDGDRGANVGFLTIARRIGEVWNENAEKVREDARTISKYTKLELEQARPPALAAINKELLEGVRKGLLEMHDGRYGGFSFNEGNPDRPKFPEPSNLLFLLDRLRRQVDDEEVRQSLQAAVLLTLDRMAWGGIRDHLGGGFHRYSVDRYWRIPHFEKMLYDNGQLASVYVEAYALTKREDYARVVRETLDFVLRELRDPQGGFYAALDAESEGEEGKFYRWEKKELTALLTPAEWERFAPVYGVSGAPNFEDEYYVPQFDRSLAEHARGRSQDEATLERDLAAIRGKLLTARNRRARPLTDTKILTSWNGIMIRGFADAGRVLRDDRYLQAARDAASFVLDKLRAPDGRLQRTFGGGQAKLNAYLDDYAFLVDGLIALHRATGEQRWLQAADQLTARQIELFWDDKQGGFFFTSSDHESLLARAKDVTDGAEPSGNSVAAGNLVYLSRALKRDDYRERARRTMETASLLWMTAPSAVPRLGIAVANYLED